MTNVTSETRLRKFRVQTTEPQKSTGDGLDLRRWRLVFRHLKVRTIFRKRKTRSSQNLNSPC